MIKWIEVHDHEGRPMFVNIDNVWFFGRYVNCDKEYTYMQFCNGECYDISDDMITIRQALEHAARLGG